MDNLAINAYRTKRFIIRTAFTFQECQVIKHLLDKDAKEELFNTGLLDVGIVELKEYFKIIGSIKELSNIIAVFIPYNITMCNPEHCSAGADCCHEGKIIIDTVTHVVCRDYNEQWDSEGYIHKRSNNAPDHVILLLKGIPIEIGSDVSIDALINIKNHFNLDFNITPFISDKITKLEADIAKIDLDKAVIVESLNEEIKILKSKLLEL